jgi:hypothetical protein
VTRRVATPCTGRSLLVAAVQRWVPGVIAFYQLGYGIAAFGVGPLLDSGGELATVYGFSAVFAATAGALSFAIARRAPRRA